jgi:hypothetical protein
MEYCCKTSDLVGLHSDRYSMTDIHLSSTFGHRDFRDIRPDADRLPA